MNELWRDYSANQDNQDTPKQVDVAVAKANGVVGIIARAGSSWTYTDPTFKNIYDQAGVLGLYRSSYYNFSPGANIDAQLTRWVDSIHQRVDIIPRFAAVEINWNNLEPSQIALEFKKFSDAYLEWEGERPGIYTRKQLADLWLTPYLDAGFLNEHWWWIAQYDAKRTTEQLDVAIVPPNKVLQERCWLKQTADQMVGFPGEAESTYVDRDRFQFENMDEWIAKNFGTDVPDIPGDCCEELSTKLDNFINGYAEDYQQLDKDLSTLEGAVENNTTHIADNASFIQKNAEDIALVGDNVQLGFGHIAEDITSLQSNINLCNIGIAELAKRIEYNYSQQVLDANNLEDMIEELEGNITGLEGGHNHPKFFKWIGWLK